MSEHNFVYFFRKEDQFEGKIKGKSLIGFPENYFIIDLETTGFDSRVDHIIEIAALKIQHNEIVDSYSSLLRPPKIYVNTVSQENISKDILIDDKGREYFYINDFISSLTGITNKMLDEAPLPKKKLAEFKEFLGKDVVLGYGVNFDVSFLYHNFEDYFRNDYIDVLRLARFLLPDFEDKTLSRISAYFGMDTTGAHRALKDCEMTKFCYDKLKNLMVTQYDSPENFIKTRINKPYKKDSDKTYARGLRAKDIKTEKTEFDEDSPIFGLHCVFTGKLEKFKRAEAMQIVANLGGINEDSVTKKTNLLILGNFDYVNLKDGKSSKQKRAEKMVLEGFDIKILSENAFYDMIDLK